MTANSTSLKSTASYIASLQLDSGALPWFRGGIVDPWDHVEAIMGLTIGGHIEQARRGFAWLRETQREDGAWFTRSRGMAMGIIAAGSSSSAFIFYPLNAWLTRTIRLQCGHSTSM